MGEGMGNRGPEGVEARLDDSAEDLETDQEDVPGQSARTGSQGKSLDNQRRS